MDTQLGGSSGNSRVRAGSEFGSEFVPNIRSFTHRSPRRPHHNARPSLALALQALHSIHLR